jgi:hypothetical protein
MITPDNQIPIDDSDSNESDDQQSQKDVHSNGLNDFSENAVGEDNVDTDKLQRAYDAAEASFTLKLGEDGDSDTGDDD